MVGSCEYGKELASCIKCGDFLTACGAVRFSGRTLLHGVTEVDFLKRTILYPRGVAVFIRDCLIINR